MVPPAAVWPVERHRSRAVYLISYAMWGAVAIRELTSRTREENFLAAAILLGAILLLILTDPFLFRRWPPYRYLYFALQTVLIQALGLLPPYQDIWGLLYILVSVQALYHLPVRIATIWGSLSALCLVLTLISTADPWYGLGLGLTYVAGSVLLVSWELFSGQAEAARRESQALLVELRQAHQRLQDYAAQVEAQAAIRERDRLAHELHDSVSQTLFGITLTAESARLLLERDPAAVPEQLERLQDMTNSALSQMRSLITQWRP